VTARRPDFAPVLTRERVAYLSSSHILLILGKAVHVPFVSAGPHLSSIYLLLRRCATGASRTRIAIIAPSTIVSLLTHFATRRGDAHVQRARSHPANPDDADIRSDSPYSRIAILSLASGAQRGAAPGSPASRDSARRAALASASGLGVGGWPWRRRVALASASERSEPTMRRRGRQGRDPRGHAWSSGSMEAHDARRDLTRPILRRSRSRARCGGATAGSAACHRQRTRCCRASPGPRRRGGAAGRARARRRWRA
jgi:hypothetical protein